MREAVSKERQGKYAREIKKKNKREILRTTEKRGGILASF